MFFGLPDTFQQVISFLEPCIPAYLDTLYNMYTVHCILHCNSNSTNHIKNKIKFNLYVKSNYCNYCRKCVVVGAGYIAVELAGILAQLGTETHLLIRFDAVNTLGSYIYTVHILNSIYLLPCIKNRFCEHLIQR